LTDLGRDVRFWHEADISRRVMVGENDAGSREREVVRRDLRRQVVGAQPVPDEDDRPQLQVRSERRKGTND
jgi:hypothetical protein